MFLTLRKAWAAIRWKMMTIFSFFSIVSVAMVTCFSIALLNVVIRRESAYLIEERIKIIAESRKGIIDPALDRIKGCEYASNTTLLALFTEHLNGTWPGSQSAAAIELLKPSLQYPDALLEVPFCRGLAYYSMKSGKEAAAEFDKAKSLRTTMVINPLLSVNQLYLARALPMAGDTAGAKREYQDLLAFWKDADPDMPLLLQARAEYAKLQ